MWNSLRQWWVSAPAAPVRRSLPQATISAPKPEAPTPAPPSEPIARRFNALLFGGPALHDGPPLPAELAVLQRMDPTSPSEAVEPLVPRLPSVLPKLIALLRRDDLDVREFASLLKRDPSLLGEVMRIANSPLYRSSGETLGSLEAALAVLGLQGIQQVVSRALMSPLFDLRHGRFSAAAGKLLWGQAERCAHACAFLRRGHADHFEAYLAGMAANVGLIVAVRLVDQARLTAAPASIAFHDELILRSAALSARITRAWCFPESVAQAVAGLAAATPSPEASQLASALCVADQASKAQMLAQSAQGQAPAVTAPAAPADACREELDRAFGLA